MDLDVLSTPQAPAAIGPYAQGIIANGFLFTAGQIAIDPSTGEMAGADIVVQTRRVLANLSALLDAAGATWDDVVKTTVYLTDMGDFPVINDIYGQAVGRARPARSTVQVAALPRGALIEMDAVARLRR